MTKQSDVVSDPQYLPVLDHGFVGVVDVSGSDAAICQAARVSYGAGTKTAREDRALIRYLMRHRHTSPFEMNAIKLHIKAPIFVFRQLIRHRTHAANEYSARYSLMSDEFYLPDASALFAQSDSNKQGRAGEISETSRDGVRWLMQAGFELSHELYRILLGPTDGTGPEERDLPYDPYDPTNPLLDDNFPGVARELARIVLPVAGYSEMYWQQSLHNLLHLIRLRSDAHAQFEIRQYADAIFQLVQPYFPEACAAFDDYVRHSATLSRMERVFLQEMLTSGLTVQDWLSQQLVQYGNLKDFAAAKDLSVRELRDLFAQFGLAEMAASLS